MLELRFEFILFVRLFIGQTDKLSDVFGVCLFVCLLVGVLRFVLQKFDA